MAPSPEALAALTELDEPLPELPMDAECVLETLDRIGSPATTGMAGRRYFGFVIGGSLPAALAANWLAGAWDQCPGLFAASPIGTVLEEVALGWLLDVLQTSGRFWRSIRNRRHASQLHCAGSGAPCGARTRRMGRRSRRVIRRAADNRSGGR